jgi:hypothetical protein
VPDLRHEYLLTVVIYRVDYTAIADPQPVALSVL